MTVLLFDSHLVIVSNFRKAHLPHNRSQIQTEYIPNTYRYLLRYIYMYMYRYHTKRRATRKWHVYVLVQIPLDTHIHCMYIHVSTLCKYLP